MTERDRLLTVAAEVRGELTTVESLARDAVDAWSRRTQVAVGDRRALVESTALRLHNFYTGCERVFETIAGELNGALPTTPDWHLRLLQSMAIAVPGVRPAVLDGELARELTEFLRFRHLVRNIYGFELREDRLQPLIDELPSTARRLIVQVERFLTELESFSRSLED